MADGEDRRRADRAAGRAPRRRPHRRDQPLIRRSLVGSSEHRVRVHRRERAPGDRLGALRALREPRAGWNSNIDAPAIRPCSRPHRRPRKAAAAPLQFLHSAQTLPRDRLTEGTSAMQMDDMILVSIDDHMIEPPDMYKNHLPAKWLDQAPKIIRNAQGIDEWTFQGEATATPFGMAATVGWPREEWGFNPGSFSELRPGCWDVHERVRDMDANGVLGSMNFPTMAGFNARTFTEAGDKELALVALRAYNDWAIEEWAGSYPGRFIPLGIVPMWDVDLAVEETKRIAKKGCRSISFLEAPHAQGFPSFLSGHWDPMLEAMSDENLVLSLH